MPVAFILLRIYPSNPVLQPHERDGGQVGSRRQIPRQASVVRVCVRGCQQRDGRMALRTVLYASQCADGGR
jgi:hypothetical protein